MSMKGQEYHNCLKHIEDAHTHVIFYLKSIRCTVFKLKKQEDTSSVLPATLPGILTVLGTGIWTVGSV